MARTIPAGRNTDKERLVKLVGLELNFRMVVREEQALDEFERRYAAVLDALLPYTEAA